MLRRKRTQENCYTTLNFNSGMPTLKKCSIYYVTEKIFCHSVNPLHLKAQNSCYATYFYSIFWWSIFWWSIHNKCNIFLFCEEIYSQKKNQVFHISPNIHNNFQKKTFIYDFAVLICSLWPWCFNFGR